MPRTFKNLPHRPAALAGLILLGLGLCLLWQLTHGAATPRHVSPLPLHAPGFTLETADGIRMRVIPLAGWRLRSPATQPPVAD